MLHVGLLYFVLAWLIHPPRFAVQAGKTSMEIDLIAAPTPAPIRTPPSPKPLVTPVPPRPVQSNPLVSVPLAPSPVPVAKAEIAVKLEHQQSPSPPKTTPAKKATISASSPGTAQAQPDDLYNKPPEYPEQSRLAREEGIVILLVEVTADGRPARITISQSSGYFRLDQAARRAVKQWKFHPAISGGNPVSSEVDVPVHFELE